ncbi:hypothetical protein [Paenibacillus sp. SI8]|uniref:hypothetical protein n=1 Tax=unclassified Paenibacillus TaxID=185978 RepID=UPI0034665E9B
MQKAQISRLENQVYSTRVLRSEFDKHWRTFQSRNGNVIYVATANRAQVEVLLAGGLRKRLIFNRGGKIIVGGGGTSHYSKPHRAINL